jgi:deoxyadenosine/deoxycytidine kinase
VHIVIAGNIGSGKSTLTAMLARHYGWEARYETVAENPYLEDYYSDLHRWAFNLEVFFLKERFRDLLDINKAENTIIQDRSIFEGVYVFMENNKAMGNLSQRDYETYMELFDQMMSVVRVPDLMIYLRASVAHLVGNIQKRGRGYEQQIQLDYLENLNRRYEDFILNKYTGKVMTIDKDNLDFQHQPKDFAKIVTRIDQTLFGLFPNSEFPIPNSGETAIRNSLFPNSEFPIPNSGETAIRNS